MSEERHRGQSEPLLHVAFGAFELDVRAGELRKHGVKIRLQEQPFRILLMLLERPGEVVLRDEIRNRLWPNDTIVEYAPSINAAIQRLRDALGDSADRPRYVETVARRGYRFIGDLLQRSVDFFIQSAAFFVSPAFFSVESLQSAANHVFRIREGAGGEPLKVIASFA